MQDELGIDSDDASKLLERSNSVRDAIKLYKKKSLDVRLLVAGVGLEPTTFGL